MEYRHWDGLGAEPSLLGFGCMRFPTLPGGGIDTAQAERMLNRAKEAGVNYFDTAWGYHDGESEPFLGRVIAQWERKSFYLATKLPTYLVNTLEEAKDYFAQQMERLGVEYVDFYLLHTLTGPRFRKMVELGVVDWCLELQRQGKIKWFGFSFHDNFAAFEEIMAHHHWDFCQLQLNYMDAHADGQVGLKGYELARTQGVPVVVMEPVRGGALASLPEQALMPLRRVQPQWPAAAWALRWVIGLDNVMTVLSGMSTMEQVEENAALCTRAVPLTAQEAAAIEETAAAIRQRVNNPCTNCRYCMPCPSGVDIPENFSIWNAYGMYQNEVLTLRSWDNLGEKAHASHCVGCGACEKLCPQQIPIRADLARLQGQIENLLAGQPG